jgi:putative AlgH/UPF0301 family transcriptional regulator
VSYLLTHDQAGSFGVNISKRRSPSQRINEKPKRGGASISSLKRASHPAIAARVCGWQLRECPQADKNSA